jgi:regulator of sirC expression with transglutaminase-like and TPR domain
LIGGALGIALHFLPHQSPVVSLEAIDEIASTVRRRVRNPTPDALLAQMHQVLFDEMGFRGNEEDYFHVDNSLIPRVLETRRGLPITLCLIYKAVGESIGLKIDGVNSPAHFLVRVDLGIESMLIDPFHMGRMLTATEAIHMIERYAAQRKHPDDEWFPRCDELQWLQRILNNLRSQLIHRGDSNHVAAMRELLALLNEDWIPPPSPREA